jgi:murein DD-endopeptidase MepM/ murein hydrolase activator NlpD
MTPVSFSRLPLTLTAIALALSACSTPDGRFDWDLRAPSAGNTADAARNATAPRPQADNRGVISYPGYQVVVAGRGDTVQAIAGRLGTSAAELGRVNALQPDLPLSGGEVLVLPGRVSEPSPATGSPGPVLPSAPGTVDVGAIATTALDRVAPPAPAAAAPAAAAPRPAAQIGKEPVRHKVKRGESAYTVARLYNVTPRALAEWNGLPADLSLREGQTLLIPPSADARPPMRVEPAAVPPGTGSPTPEPPSATRPLPAENPVRAGGGNPAGAPPSPALPVTAGGKLAMPADGAVIRAYQKGRYDGIGIGAAAGSPVRAAAEGTVAAITRDTEQVPIVVIRHADNLLTVYANVDGITVAKDARVTRGQQIGKVRAGNPPFLHFEVRRGGDSVDPMTMLR